MIGFMKKLTFITILFTIWGLVPTPVLGAGSLTATDTVAGIGTEISAQGFAAHEALALKLLPPLGAAVPLTATTDDQGKTMIRVNGEETQVAGPYAVENDGSAVRATFQVLPDSLDPHVSSIESDTSSILPDGNDEARLTVLLRDRYGNPLSSHPVQLISSRSADVIRPLTAETDLDGQQLFAYSTRLPGAASLRAIDLITGKTLDAQVTLTAGEETWSRGVGGTTEDSWGTAARDTWGQAAMPRALQPVGEFQGRTLFGQLSTLDSFDVIDHFRVEIDGGKTEIPIRTDTTFLVVAEDRSDRTVEDYAGQIRFSSTDAKAILPFGSRQFALKDLGSKTFTLGLRFNTGGEQTFAVEDSSGNIRGSVTVQVTGGSQIPGQSKITITEPAEGTTVNTSIVTLTGTSQPLINLLVTGGTEIARGDTNEAGAFEVIVKLNTASTGATLQVEEAGGKFKSNPLHLTIDLVGPRIVSVDYEPQEPVEGQDMTVTVKTEARVSPVTMTLEGTETTLVETATQPGTFTASFTAPAKVGTYQPQIKAVDALGNSSEMLTNFTVKPKTPPTVRRLTAEAKASAVALKWDPVAQGEADTYRVYVGERADNFAYSLDTDASVSAATVAGLKQGTTYYFAVTALLNGIESAEKSNIASATVLGIRLSVVPGDASLLLQWNSIKKSTPLSTYLLEYGVSSDALTEKRMISGDADTYTLRDLLNGVTYSLRLTPVTVPGELLRDLAALGEGTPNGSGFHAVAGSGSTFSVPPSTVPPPSVVKPGMPPIAWAGIVTGAAILLFVLMGWRRRRSLRVTAAFLQDVQQRYRV